jgi:hypothetical protein
MAGRYDNGMIKLTEAQQKTIQKMRGYRVMAQLTTGAVLVAFNHPKHRNAMMIDNAGDALHFTRLLACLDQDAQQI